MKMKAKVLAFVSLLLPSLFTDSSATISAQVPGRRVIVIPRVASNRAWVPGHYVRRGRDYLWVDGHYQYARMRPASVPARYTHWQPGYWRRTNYGPVWVKGYWY